MFPEPLNDVNVSVTGQMTVDLCFSIAAGMYLMTQPGAYGYCSSQLPLSMSESDLIDAEIVDSV